MKTLKKYLSLFAILAISFFGAQQAQAHCGHCKSDKAKAVAAESHDHAAADHSHNEAKADCCGKCGGKGKSECAKDACDAKGKSDCTKGACDSKDKKGCCGECGGKGKSECAKDACDAKGKSECTKGACDSKDKKSCCGKCGGKEKTEAAKPDACCPPAPATEASNQEAADYNGDWLNDFSQAKAIAASTGRPILINFTGSDWCGWCIKLDKEVFSQKAFKEYAAEELVLFKADFPRKTKLPANVTAQNRKLAGQYKIEGYPTVILVNAEGEVIHRTGYESGGADKYVKSLNKEIASL